MKPLARLIFPVIFCLCWHGNAETAFSQEIFPASLPTIFPDTAPGFSLADPKNGVRPPDYAVGFGSRDPNKNYHPEFLNPPLGYGNVPFFWWMGDKLTQERLAWQLERFQGMATSGFQVNYAHSDKGGQLWGYTYASDPPLFSDAWWRLHSWFMQEAKKLGAGVSLSDYTLGISQGWKWDEAIHDYPEIIGKTLDYDSRDRRPDDTLAEGEFLVPDAKDTEARYISRAAIGGKIHTVFYRLVNPSIDPMHPKSGAAVVEKFFQPFLDHNPGEGGKGLNFFFSDELDFRVHGRLWNDYFADEFIKMKGYDVRPYLAALFTDIGPRTVKVRLDYYDVLVELSERNYFKPVYDWHQKNGMIYGCDHGGRGGDVSEFGDYFRTQRWNQGPGSDQPGLGRDLVKAKVASSLAHLYERPRVWLEGFYSSGWGTGLESLTDATFADFVMGYNLLSLHGYYYSTKGGWWEWAPPCNHWRNPSWKHQKVFMDATQRLAYLLTQGTHAADVAILYPVAPRQAGIDPQNAAVNSAFDACRQFYGNGIDLDFIDFQSIDRAEIKDGRLNVSGESYRVLVLPNMKAIRHSTLQKAAEFARAGGIVVTIGVLPEFSDRMGADDPEVKKLAAELPEKTRFADVGSAVNAVKKMFTQDIQVKNGRAAYFVHRKVGRQDIYVLFQVSENAEILFRSTGKAETWDIWNGEKTPLASEELPGGVSRVMLQNTSQELIIIAFSPDEKNIPLAENEAGNHTPRWQNIPSEDWACEYIPTMDNTWGDFRWPVTKNTSISPKIGPEARRFMFNIKETETDPERYTYEFGPKFRQLGPISIPAENPAELAAFEKKLSQIAAFPVTETFRGETFAWKNYDFSWRWGVEGDPGHQGYHGLKENMYDTFIRLGKFQQLGHLNTGRGAEFTPKDAEETAYYLWSTVTAEKPCEAVILTHGMKPVKAWMNGGELAADTDRVSLRAGVNPVLLKYDGPGIGYFLLVSPESEFAAEANPSVTADGSTFHPKTAWIWNAPGENTGSGYYRKTFTLGDLPKSARFRLTADDRYTLFVNGKPQGSGGQWSQADEYDVLPHLRAGENEIVVYAVNEGGPSGWIGELHLDGTRAFGTDKTWLTAPSPKPGETWTESVEISPYAGSLWATHQYGPPRLAPVSQVSPADIHETVGTLAMRWNAQENVLAGLKPGIFAYDIFGGKPVIGVYEFQVAPGTTALELSVRQGILPVKCTLDDAEIPVTGRIISLPEIAETGGTVRLEIPQLPGLYAGEMLPEPISLRTKTGLMNLGDWTRNSALECYSGGILYRKTLTVTENFLGQKVYLKTDHLNSSAEVRVNGVSVGVRIKSPWRWEVTDLLRDGENTVEIEVYNTLAPHYLTIPTSYRGDSRSGILNTVRLTTEK